ncbi:Ankyrin repeat family protein, partial [Prunus dulcis]
IKTLGFGRFEFGCRLSLDRISPIVRFPGFDRSLIGVPDTPKFQTLDVVEVDDDCTEFGSPARRHLLPLLQLCWTTWWLVPASQAPASSASSVAQQLVLGGAPAHRHHRHEHRPTVLVLGLQPAKKNTRGPCRQLKTAKVTRVTNSRISIGYDERHQAAPTAELHSSLAHDIGHVVRPIARCNGSLGRSCLRDQGGGSRPVSTNNNLEDLDEESLTYMSDLIRRGRSMTTAPSSDPPARSASAATAPALLDHVVVGPGASQAPASSASSVAQPASARRRHRPTDTIDTTSTDGTGASDTASEEEHRGPCRQLKTAKVTRVTNSRISIGYDERHQAAPTAELHSSLAHDIGHVVRTHCPMQWKSWKVMPDEIKVEVRGQLSTNNNLEDLDEESLTYVNRLFAERYKQWKSNLHHHFLAFDDPQVALQEGCPKELEGGRINKAQVNKGNRKKKTLLHHSGSRPFSYRMDARRREGSKFQRSTSLVTFMFDPGMNDDGGEEPVGFSGVRLPASSETPIESVAPPQDAGFQILTETLDQTLGRRPGTYCRGMGNARRREPRPRSSAQSNSQVTALTAQVATLQSQMSVILQSLAQSGIPVPHFDAPTSQPVHPEHAHQTTAPMNAQTSEPHTRRLG